MIDAVANLRLTPTAYRRVRATLYEECSTVNKRKAQRELLYVTPLVINKDEDESEALDTKGNAND